MMNLKALAIAAALTLLPAVANASGSVAFERLKEYVSIDTVNPPGNESRGVKFFADILTKAGIPFDSAESAPGRGNIWAKLEGGDKPALVLLHHIDVVPATAEKWLTDPLNPIVKDGALIGRGTLDTKALGIMHLEAFLALAASGVPLERDVLFLATADEEAGGMMGAGWMVAEHPELFTNVGYLLNEGGLGRKGDDHEYFGIEIAQKRPNWIRLTATDTPGHGSMPRPTSAATRIIEALHRIHTQPFETRVTPKVREMFRSLAPHMNPENRAIFADIDSAVQRPGFIEQFHAKNPMMTALLRNTCSITMLEGSQKVNVISPTASAELDCRILPDQDPDEFLQQIRQRVADDSIEIERYLAFPPSESSADTPLFSILEEALKSAYPAASTVPSVSTGFTDSHFFRDLGIVSYGFLPILVPDSDLSGIHGNNEKINIETFENGVDIMTRVVQKVATQ